MGKAITILYISFLSVFFFSQTISKASHFHLFINTEYITGSYVQTEENYEEEKFTNDNRSSFIRPFGKFLFISEKACLRAGISHSVWQPPE